MNAILAAILVFITILVVPILIYGAFTNLFGLPEPDKKPRFFIGIAIQKIAATTGFVLLFMIAGNTFDEKWLLYGLVWFVMYAITEVGQVFMPHYTKLEAIAGIISEAIYFPLSALILHSIF